MYVSCFDPLTSASAIMRLLLGAVGKVQGFDFGSVALNRRQQKVVHLYTLNSLQFGVDAYRHDATWLWAYKNNLDGRLIMDATERLLGCAQPRATCRSEASLCPPSPLSHDIVEMSQHRRNACYYTPSDIQTSDTESMSHHRPM